MARASVAAGADALILEVHPDPAAAVSDGQQSLTLDQFDALVPEFREVVVLSVAGGLNYREVADVLDCPVGTVMSRMARARRLLRERLADYAAAGLRGRPARKNAESDGRTHLKRGAVNKEVER